MPVEVEVHTVPHFKAPINGKIDLWGPECGGTFTLDYTLVNIGHLLHKLRPVPFVFSSTVGSIEHAESALQSSFKFCFLHGLTNYIGFVHALAFFVKSLLYLPQCMFKRTRFCSFFYFLCNKHAIIAFEHVLVNYVYFMHWHSM